MASIFYYGVQLQVSFAAVSHNIYVIHYHLLLLPLFRLNGYATVRILGSHPYLGIGHDSANLQFLSMFTSLFYITNPLAQQTRKTKGPAFLFVCCWEVEGKTCLRSDRKLESRSRTVEHTSLPSHMIKTKCQKTVVFQGLDGAFFFFYVFTSPYTVKSVVFDIPVQFLLITL